jgi:peptidoglycan/LPS O-acetylase OafA/YrhL
MKRLPALDALRGIAILIVLVHHYVPEQFKPPLFWSGVDLFFVLSGFLITDILLKNVNAENYYLTFYIRRAARILPLYWLLLLAFFLVMKLEPEMLGSSFSKHLPFWSYITFTQNFLYSARNFWRDPWLDVTWSLALEEQFYIFLSISVRNLNKKYLAGLSIFLILLAPVLRFFTDSPLVSYQLPFHRADSLMLGVVIAILWQSHSAQTFIHAHKKYFLWSLPVFFAGIAYLFKVKAGIGLPIPHLFLAFFYADLLLLALVNSPQAPGLFFGNKLIGWLGIRSYGIYLLHKPIRLVFVTLLSGFSISLDPVASTLIVCVLLFALAEISYRLVEKPIMNWGHHFKYRKALLPEPSLEGGA